MDKNDKIIRKIKHLLAIAKDRANDEECQSAFLLAQKLMIQYQIDQNLIDDSTDNEQVVNEQDVTVYKKLYRWERSLASIVADNFRVKIFIRNTHTSGKIVFYGLKQDLELAKEIYLFAYESILYFAKNYMRMQVQEQKTAKGTWDRRRKLSQRAFGEKMKKAYIKGFLSGLDDKFSEQKANLSYEVMVLTNVPEVVEDSWEIFSKDFGTYGTARKEEKLTEEELDAYAKGYKQGKTSDFTYARIA